MKAFHKAVCAALACAASAILHAQTIDRPALKEGDKWLYSVRTEENKGGALISSTRRYEAWVSRVGSHSFVMANKPVDSNLPPHEANLNLDWSIPHVVNGEERVTSRPYVFPLEPGKTWDTDQTQPHPTPAVKTLRNKLHYTVIGWDEIKVPAGTFKALKIEMEGNWFKEFEPQAASASGSVRAEGNAQAIIVNSQAAHTPDPIGGRMYKLYWYAPEIKRDVKMIVEDYDAGGTVQHRTTEELESFTTH
jgi:hypothetical protein